MKLCIKEKVFSWNDRFTVWDEWGNEKYFVEGELFSWGKKLHVYDAAGNEAAFIQQKILSIFPRYHVFIGGRQAAEIVKEFSFLFPRYSIEGDLNWEVNGRMLEHDYEISCSGGLVAGIHKEWLTWGDCYTIDIVRPEDSLVALAVVLAIDCVTESSSGNGISFSIGSN